MFRIHGEINAGSMHRDSEAGVIVTVKLLNVVNTVFNISFDECTKICEPVYGFQNKRYVIGGFWNSRSQ